MQGERDAGDTGLLHFSADPERRGHGISSSFAVGTTAVADLSGSRSSWVGHDLGRRRRYTARQLGSGEVATTGERTFDF